MTAPTKTYVVDPAVRAQVLTLFGTTANAAERLELGHLGYATLNQALRGYPVRPEHGQELEHAWQAWAEHHLRGVALGLHDELSDFTVPEPDETADLEHQELKAWRTRLTKTKQKVDLEA